MSDRMFETEIWTIARMDTGTALLLRPVNSNLAVPIFIGESEAQAILLGLSGMTAPRPITHDLFLDLIKKDSLVLCRVEIHDLRDNIFYARLILTGREFSEKAPLVLDSRPSDALALAVRCKCPVFIFPKVTDQAALPLDFFLDALGDIGGISADTDITDISKPKRAEPERPGFIARRETLRMELDQAVAAEEYERAAELRDVLALLDKEGRNGR
jgi:bifunctional DNase/RNase